MIPETRNTKPGTIAALCGVFGLALGIRLILLWSGAGVPLDSGDPPSFLSIAHSLAEGRGYSLDGITPTAMRTPLYPFFLSFVFLVPGAGITAVQTVQAILGSMGCALIFLTGRILLGARAGLLAGILAAAYLPGAYADVSILSESLFGILLVSAVLFLSRPSRSLWDSVLAGVFMGLSALARPNGIPVAACMAVWLLMRSAPRHAAVFAVAAGLVAFPWTLRNALVFHRFIPTYTTSGITLYNSYAIPSEGLGFNSLEGVPEAYWNLPDESSRDAFLTAQAIRYIREHPALPFQLLPAKLALLIYPYDLRWIDPRIPFRYNLFWGMMGTLAFLGLAAGLRGNWRRLEPLAPPFVALAILSAVFYGSPRMRLPFDNLLMIPAAGGLVWLTAPGRRRFFIGWAVVHGVLLLAGEIDGVEGWIQGLIPW